MELQSHDRVLSGFRSDILPPTASVTGHVMAKSTSSADVAALQADLDRASKRQRATADVLRAISSSPAELQPVLDAIVTTVLELCDAYDVAIVIREGDFLVPLAHRGPIPITFARWPITRGWVTGRAFVDPGRPRNGDAAGTSN